MASSVHKVDISWDRRSSGAVAHVVFDNARRLNVLNPPALLDLTEAFRSLAREDDLRVVVLSGAGGRAFAEAKGFIGLLDMQAGSIGLTQQVLAYFKVIAIRHVRVWVRSNFHPYKTT